jgi:polar amino acid transport system substrate-binding protein
VLSLLLALALCLALALPAVAGPTLDRIAKSGQLVLGTDPAYPPLTMKTKKGEIIGLDIDLARALAMEMGVKLKIKAIPFTELLGAVKAGKVDIAMSGMTITAKRNMQVIFVGPYMIAGQAVLTSVTMAGQLTNSQALNSPKIKIAVAKGTTGEMALKQVAPNATKISATNQQAALDMLLAKKVDAVMADYPFCAMASLRYKDKGIMTSDRPFTFEPFGIAVKPGDGQLVNIIEHFLLMVEASGTKKILKKKWFENPGWIKLMP